MIRPLPYREIVPPLGTLPIGDDARPWVPDILPLSLVIPLGNVLPNITPLDGRGYAMAYNEPSAPWRNRS